MASVKFNQGLLSQADNNGANALGFLAKDATAKTNGDYGYLYLGPNLVASKYLNALDPTNIYMPNSDETTWSQTSPALNGSIVLTGDLTNLGGSGTASPIVTCRLMVKASQVTSNYDPEDNEFLTAAATANLISNMASASDYYHMSGSWGANDDNWNIYTAASYKGSTQITDTSSADYKALSFTLPVHTWSTTSAFASDYSHLATPEQVANYIATMSGAMEYKGQLTSTMAAGGTGTHPAYKPGDTFIASEPISSIHAEAGDMVIVSAAIAQDAAFASSGQGANCNVFERNLDGALIKSTSNFNQYGVAYVENTTGTIASTAVGTSGQYLKSNGSAAPTWADDIYYLTAAGTTADIITVTRYKNGSVDSSYNETGWTNGVRTITINDVAHATNADKILQTVSTANADVPLLIGQNNSSTADPAITDSTPKDINYSALIKANASTGMITSKDLTVNTKTGSTYGEDTIDVAAALTWQTLS